MALFFVKAEGLANELKPDVTFPFPFWVEVDQTWTVRYVSSRSEGVVSNDC